jgi:drug/metabolite transporter (DMT)-like permease
MLRGAVVIFTGFFSVVFLKRKLSKSQWIALFLVMIGVSIVGMSNIITKSLPTSPIGEKEEEDNLGILNNHVSSKNILGVGMVILAQIFTALQFIIEEKVMSRYEVGPLKTVGLEGTFGLFTVLGAIPFLYFFIGRYHQGGFFDIPDGASQIFSNMTILLISIGCICSIAFFNWFGLSVTNAVSATSRSTIDTCRTVLIWMISLYLGWETFNWFQVLGFIVLIYGTFIFNGIANLPFSINKTEIEHRIPNERRPLLDDSSSPISPDDENHFTNL